MIVLSVNCSTFGQASLITFKVAKICYQEQFFFKCVLVCICMYVVDICVLRYIHTYTYYMHKHKNTALKFYLNSNFEPVIVLELDVVLISS